MLITKYRSPILVHLIAERGRQGGLEKVWSFGSIYRGMKSIGLGTMGRLLFRTTSWKKDFHVGFCSSS
jgi:hypothetical protein